MKRNRSFDYCKNFKYCFIVSACILLAGILVAVIFGVGLDIDFKGGSRFTYSYTGDIVLSDAQKIIEEAVEQSVKVGQNSDISGKTTYLSVSLVADQALTTEQQTAIISALQEKFPDNNIQLGDSNTVNPSVAGSFFVKSIAAVILAGVLVIIYIGVRFRKIGGVSAGVMAFIALINDVLVAFVACVIFRLDIDSNFIAVVLTILGYSLNDTVVIYDRVRENKKFYPTMSVRENMNLSIKQSFGRTLVTAIATFAAIVIVIIVAEINGLTSLRTFAIPMAIGIISGFYTSVFLCGPMWVIWREYSDKKAATKKSRKKAK